jgi:hypothetical protein
MGCKDCGNSKSSVISTPKSRTISSDCCGKEKKPFTKYSLFQAGKSIIKHYLDPKYNAFSSPEIKAARLDACNNCEHLTVLVKRKQCLICKCFIEPKASLIDQKCPHPQGSKWEKVEK